jgi:hypothetical protein
MIKSVWQYGYLVKDENKEMKFYPIKLEEL